MKIEKIPDLKPGEIKVASFTPPASFLQVVPGVRHPAGSSRGEDVSLATLVESAGGIPREVQLPVSS
jgi:hypothetical protein